MNCEFPSYLDDFSKDFAYSLTCNLAQENLQVGPAVVDDSCRWLTARAAYVSQRALISAFHTWREGEGLEPKGNSNEAHNEFSRLLSFPDRRLALVDTHFPKLGILLKEIYENSLKFALQVIRDFYNDIPRLASFGVDEGATVKSLQFHDEETHNRGKTAVLVDVGSTKIMYKPRSGQGEILIDKVCRFLGAQPYQLVARTVDMGGHCWQEYIPTTEDPVIDIEQYMASAGLLLAACHILGTTDLHADNVLCSSQGHPVVIDGETAIQFRIPGEVPVDASDVLTSGFLPTALANNTFWRYYSGLAVNTRCSAPEYTAFKVINSGKDDVAFRRFVGIQERKTLPYTVPSENFAKVFDVLIKNFNQARQTADNSELANFLVGIEHEHTWRQVIRSTGVYSAVLDATLMPEALAGEEHPEDLLEERPSDAFSQAIGDQEREQLAIGDIPYFLLDGTGNIYDGNRQYYGQVHYSERLSLPSRRHADFISSSGERYVNVLKANAHLIGLSSSSQQTRSLLVDSLEDEIMARRTNLTGTRDSRWLAFDIQEDAIYLDTTSVSFLMADGTDWALGSPAPRKSRAAEDRWEEHVRTAPRAVANFVGFGPGTATLVTHRGRQESESETARINVTLAALTDVLSHGQVDADYIGGVESALAALGTLSVDVEPGLSRNLVRQVSTFLLPRLEANLQTDHHGIAHGSAGTLMAAWGVEQFCIAQNLQVPAQLKHYAEIIAARILTAAQSLVEDRSTNNRLAWCNGLSGMVGVLVITGTLSGDSDLVREYVDAAFLELTEARASGRALDVSLCHGSAGTLSTLQLLSDYGVVDQAVPETYQANFLAAIEESEVYCGYPANILDMGFLNGLGGTFHALRLSDSTPTIRPLYAGN